jgi:cell division protein FtsZ
MTLNEVQMLMDALSKHTGDDTQILFGASVDTSLAGRMGVTLISSSGIAASAGAEAPEFVPRIVPVPAAVHAPAIPAARQPVEEEEVAMPVVAASEEAAEARVADPEPDLVAAAVAAEASTEEQPSFMEMAPQPERPSAEVHPVPLRVPRAPRQPRIVTGAKDPGPVAPAASRREEKQEILQFEPVTRGRFEKSEPTIVDGQDLDVPTFLRRNLRVS